ncbi:hypothetical protein Gotri_007723 [Gossypium trilobum]|uniref:Uncharacterized protein n=1 Tax=Gossypium trilobum TaxID=34281 RepID=A0A7J9EH21_9ROSI|nr:hypothetical protein [Gossypium trilobum]
MGGEEPERWRLRRERRRKTDLQGRIGIVWVGGSMVFASGSIVSSIVGLLNVWGNGVRVSANEEGIVERDEIVRVSQ